MAWPAREVLPQNLSDPPGVPNGATDPMGLADDQR